MIMHPSTYPNAAYAGTLSSSELFGNVSAVAAQAAQCRSVAEALDGSRRRLPQRYEPVLKSHTEEVWRGRSATASRERLRRIVVRSLHSAESDLAGVSRALRAEAERLDEFAAALHREALLVAEAESRAAERELARQARR